VITRRHFLTLGSLTLAGGSLAFARGRGSVDDEPLPDGSNARNMVTPEAEQAISHGLEYLARSQHQDGSFGTGQYHGNVAITSLAALAFMSGGNQPDRGLYGKRVTDALQFVLDQEEGRRGYLHNRGISTHGPMYGHGFGTLFLGEVYGMVRSADLRDRLRGTLKRAVDLIIASQNAKGGWRYQPESKDADISVTICQIMALRSARNAGFSVPKETVDRCIRYVRSCQEPGGGFRYMDQGGAPAFARTAAGVVALYSAGVYKDPAVDRGLKYLLRHKPSEPGTRFDMHYFYGHYYAAQAMWTAGTSYWTSWYPAIRDELMERSHRFRQDGSWTDPICSHYATAMACIILQIPNNYLPILQK
jgi:prenyltransferase beta subunit